MIEEDFVARLLADTALASLVGDRIDWIERPQAAALPSITLQMITTGRTYTFKGPTGFTGSRVQIDCWGASYLSAKQVSRAVIAAVEPAAVQGGTKFGPSFLENAPDLPPEDVPGGGTAYRVNMDFIVWHRPEGS